MISELIQTSKSKLIKELDSKGIKKINDFNQIVKKIFKTYYIDNENLIMFTTDDKYECTNKGAHFCHLDNTSINPFIDVLEGRICCFDSHVIFKTIQEEKKKITGISADDSCIYFVMKDGDIVYDKFIGQHFMKDRLNMTLSKSLSKAINYFNTFENTSFEKVSDDIIQKLINNSLIKYHYNDITFRITKELLPNLKKDSNISLSAINAGEDLFTGILYEERNGICIYNIYTPLINY